MEKNKLELYQHLKSVAIYLQPNVDETDYELEVDELTKWLTHYNQWFKETVVVNKGYRPYVLYNREVSVLGNDIFAVPDKLMELAKSTINNGFAFSITADIVELFHNYSHLKVLCDDSLLSSVGVTTDNLFVLAKLTSVKDFMGLLINLRRPIGIIGSISTLREYGFLGYESVNSTDITIYPIKSEISHFWDIVPENPVNQCANRLKLYIDGDGNIYPCYGLVGLRECSLGNIKDGFENSTFVTDNYDLDLLELKRKGPKLRESTNQLQRVSTLPWVCERHRMELLMN